MLPLFGKTATRLIFLVYRTDQLIEVTKFSARPPVFSIYRNVPKTSLLRICEILIRDNLYVAINSQGHFGHLYKCAVPEDVCIDPLKDDCAETCCKTWTSNFQIGDREVFKFDTGKLSSWNLWLSLNMRQMSLAVSRLSNNLICETSDQVTIRPSCWGNFHKILRYSRFSFICVDRKNV